MPSTAFSLSTFKTTYSRLMLHRALTPATLDRGRASFKTVRGASHDAPGPVVSEHTFTLACLSRGRRCFSCYYTSSQATPVRYKKIVR